MAFWIIDDALSIMVVQNFLIILQLSFLQWLITNEFLSVDRTLGSEKSKTVVQEHQSGASGHRYVFNSIKLFHETSVLLPTSQCGRLVGSRTSQCGRLVGNRTSQCVWSQKFKRSSLTWCGGPSTRLMCVVELHIQTTAKCPPPDLWLQILLKSLEISLLHCFLFFLYFPESSRSTGIKRAPHPILPPACVALPTVLLGGGQRPRFHYEHRTSQGFCVQIFIFFESRCWILNVRIELIAWNVCTAFYHCY